METNDMIKCISELSEKLTESERFTQQLSKKLEKAREEAQTLAKEAIQAIEKPSTPLPSDRDVAWRIASEILDDSRNFCPEDVAALIAAHREAAVKAERERFLLLAAKYVEFSDQVDYLHEEIMQGDGK